MKGRSSLFIALCRERGERGAGKKKRDHSQLVSGESDLVCRHLLAEVNKTVLPHHPVHT